MAFPVGVASTSFGNDPAGFDGSLPLLYFCLHELRQVRWRRTIWRYHRGTEFFEPFAHPGRLDGLHRGLMKTKHDSLRRAARKIEREPRVGLEACKTLLLCGRQLGEEPRTLTGQHSNRFHGAGANLRERRRQRLAEEVDPTANQV